MEGCIQHGLPILHWHPRGGGRQFRLRHCSARLGLALSHGLAIVPTIIMTLGAFFISDTPSSLVERSKQDMAKKTLAKALGGEIVDIETEFAILIKSSEIAKTYKPKAFKDNFEETI
ncbi:hypothetical protein ACH5RR_034574 [Cinchona calisaya]|uniref:Uncharacterized protein n=1 Tax=Cinchona calisaya TaxID=153742 RepID=A0ABD2YBA6_9GENT